MRFYEAPVARDQPAIWLDHGGEQFPVIRRSDVSGYPHVLWPHIVRALTAGPTLESARVVVETLHKEVQELRRANDDLNRELRDLRRSLPPDPAATLRAMS